MTLYRWWRNIDALGSPGRNEAFEHNIGIPTVGIVEGQTMTRIIGRHFVFHRPATGKPTPTGSVLLLSNRWLLVWDDGTDPNIGTGDLDYMLTAHTHDILYQGAWYWTHMFGTGFDGGIQIYGQMYDGLTNPAFEVQTQRRWRPEGANIQYPRYVSKTYPNEINSQTMDYYANMDIAVLAATPGA